MRKAPVQNTKVMTVKISDLRMDFAVQRPLYLPKVQQIAENFDPAALRTLTVSERRDGTYVILDGQHRVAAMKENGYANGHLVYCEVHEGLSLHEEAELFLKLNDARKPSYREAFDVRLTARDPDALGVKEAIEECELLYRPEANSRQERVVRGIAACEKVYRGFSRTDDPRRYPLELKQTLLMLKTAWGATPASLQSSLISGGGRFWLRYGLKAVDFDRLTNNLSKYPGGPNNLIVWAKQQQATIGTQLDRAIAEAFVLQHNKGLRNKSKQLADWR
jgi:hypothetical protein